MGEAPEDRSEKQRTGCPHVSPRESSLLMLLGRTRNKTLDVLDCLDIQCPIKQDVGWDGMYIGTLSGVMFLYEG
jgi:hypothetical protein